MANHLLLYRSTESSQDQMTRSTPEEMQAEMRRWEEWGAKVGPRMVDFGAPCMDRDGIGSNFIGGYSIVSAETADELAALLAGHPHLDFGTIQSLELLAVPGM